MPRTAARKASSNVSQVHAQRKVQKLPSPKCRPGHLFHSDRAEALGHLHSVGPTGQGYSLRITTWKGSWGTGLPGGRPLRGGPRHRACWTLTSTQRSRAWPGVRCTPRRTPCG